MAPLGWKKVSLGQRHSLGALFLFTSSMRNFMNYKLFEKQHCKGATNALFFFIFFLDVLKYT